MDSSGELEQEVSQKISQNESGVCAEGKDDNGKSFEDNGLRVDGECVEDGVDTGEADENGEPARENDEFREGVEDEGEQGEQEVNVDGVEESVNGQSSAGKENGQEEHEDAVGLREVGVESRSKEKPRWYFLLPEEQRGEDNESPRDGDSEDYNVGPRWAFEIQKGRDGSSSESEDTLSDDMEEKGKNDWKTEHYCPVSPKSFQLKTRMNDFLSPSLKRNFTSSIEMQRTNPSGVKNESAKDDESGGDCVEDGQLWFDEVSRTFVKEKDLWVRRPRSPRRTVKNGRARRSQRIQKR